VFGGLFYVDWTGCQIAISIIVKSGWLSGSKSLMPFQQKPESFKKTELQKSKELPLVFSDDLELLDWTGRQLSSNHKAAISSVHSPILDRLKLNREG
jgi:hypothetical protein